MCGKALPFREARTLGGGCASGNFGGIASSYEKRLIGKAEPFRTSSGEAARIRDIFRRCEALGD
jgi:hypothetical protein